jgi:hypothetical protein
MPLFEVDARRSTLVQPLAPSDTGFVEQAAPVVDDHVSRLLGEQIFPVLQRGPGVRREDAPHLLALDAAGQPVVLEMVSKLDAASLALALAHAGRAGRLTRADVAEKFPEGVRQFERAFATFRDAAPIARTQGQREGSRLLLLCAQVDPAINDALDFLRLTTNAVTVLRLGVVTGPDGRRLVEVEPLHGASRRGRSGSPTQATPASSGGPSGGASGHPSPSSAREAASTAEPKLESPTEPTSSEPEHVAPRATRTPPTRTSTRSARLPNPPGDLARAAIATRAGQTGDVAPTPAPQPSASADRANTPLPTRRSARERRDATYGSHPSEHTTGDLDATSLRHERPAPGSTPASGPTPAPAPPPAPTRKPVARRAASSSSASRHDEIGAIDDATRISPLSAPLPMPASDLPLAGTPSDDDPDLFMLAQNIGRATPLVWARPRRGQHFDAVLLPSGQIEVPGRGRYRNPDAAATAVVGQDREDGWDVWRLGVSGPSLTEVFREQFA